MGCPQLWNVIIMMDMQTELINVVPKGVYSLIGHMTTLYMPVNKICFSIYEGWQTQNRNILFWRHCNCSGGVRLGEKIYTETMFERSLIKIMLIRNSCSQQLYNCFCCAFPKGNIAWRDEISPCLVKLHPVLNTRRI